MAQILRDLMTTHPVTVESRNTVAAPARMMRDSNIGDVILLEQGQVRGILTDRDIVVRVIAEGLDPNQTPVAAIASRELTILAPTASVEEAAAIMRQKAIRRLPIVEDGRPVGIVSIGDLAVEGEPASVLGAISARPPNR